jgi:Cu/Ag efflux protein CusF
MVEISRRYLKSKILKIFSRNFYRHSEASLKILCNTQIQPGVSMKPLPILCALLFTFTTLVLPLQANNQSSGKTDNQNGTVAWKQVERSGTIEKVMPDSQKVWVKTDDGRTIMFTITPDVNLQNIKKGDRVNATFFQSVALDVHTPTADERKNPLQIDQTLIPPPPGVNTQAGGIRQIRALITIDKINKSDQTVVVTGPEGESGTIFVQDKSMFDKLKEGQQVTIVYTEAVAVKVEKR